MAKRKSALQIAKAKVKELDNLCANLRAMLNHNQAPEILYDRAARAAIENDEVEKVLKSIQGAVIAVGPTTPRFSQIITLLRWAEGKMVENRENEKNLANKITRVSPLPVYDQQDFDPSLQD